MHENTGLESKVRIFIVDDHEMILPGLKIILESTGRFNVIGMASEGLTAINQIVELSPDIAIVDLSIPIFNGFEIIKQLRIKKHPVKIIILTSYLSDAYIREALKLRVDGYILKENTTSELKKAIETVSSGYKFFSPKVMTRIIDELDNPHNEYQGYLAIDSLTKREMEVMKLISEGKKGREICNMLGICESTLKTHKWHLMQKLKVSSVNELILYTAKNNIFPIDLDVNNND